MPMLTIAMADVPQQDAGLGSGIVNVSQQVSGALGLALLTTFATNHTSALIAAGHPVNAGAAERLPARVRARDRQPC